MTGLTILCVTRFDAHAEPFVVRMADQAAMLGAGFVLGADGPPPAWVPDTAHIVALASGGFIESVLDQAVAACPDGYILRVDDDEQLSSPLFRWLERGGYLEHDHWAFPRMHLWPDAEHYVTSPPLWPDLQTRLSVKALAGQRRRIHEGSPFGTGRLAEGIAIEHHKFLVRPLAEREALLDHYEALQPGAGGQQFDAFSLPERYESYFLEGIETVPR
jgi:hypothetical protein